MDGSHEQQTGKQRTKRLTHTYHARVNRCTTANKAAVSGLRRSIEHQNSIDTEGRTGYVLLFIVSRKPLARPVVP